MRRSRCLTSGATNGTIHGIDRVLMKGNISMLREAGAAIESGVKTGADKVKDTLGDDKQ